MYIDCQFFLSTSGCIGHEYMVGVGLPLPCRTKSSVPYFTLLKIKADSHICAALYDLCDYGESFSESGGVVWFCQSLLTVH